MNIDHAISVSEDPFSVQSFVTVVLFLPSGVHPSSVRVSVSEAQDVLCYGYDRPKPASDSERLCRAWTTPKPDGAPAKFRSYHPFLGITHIFQAVQEAR